MTKEIQNTNQLLCHVFPSNYDYYQSGLLIGYEYLENDLKSYKYKQMKRFVIQASSEYKDRMREEYEEDKKLPFLTRR